LISQSKKPDTVFCDCNKARIVSVTGRTKLNKTIAPIGFGSIQEISNTKQNTKYAFEKEHNTAWYKLSINVTGTLTFDITPSRPGDDYDFMLFKANKTTFCDSLLNHKIPPVRACISRNKDEISGKTGLNHQSKEAFSKQGVAAAYGKAIEVREGEIYYLVVDNVYEKGDGHTIEFEITQPVLFNGTVTDDNHKPIQTDIALTNERGDTVSIEKTHKDGSYKFIAPLSKNQSYNLNFYNDSSFSYTSSVTLADTARLTSLTTVLPKLKKGSKYSVGSINFIPGSVQYLRRAIPSMNNLVKLLKKNRNLRIKIIGHQNGWSMDDNRDIAFTRARARTIRDYLIIQGIDEKRIQIGGKGGQEMLFELPATEIEQEQNRRVEILVLEY
jgi:outer membrane protein OmpA-like peptidoglycan-associated protein